MPDEQHELPCWVLSPHVAPPDEATRASFELAVHALIRSWQIIPSSVDRVLSWGNSFKGSDCYSLIQDFNTAIRAFGKIQLRLSERLCSGFDSMGIDYCLLKSSASRLTFYPTPLDRCGIDIDVAVSSSDICAAENLALNLGFCKASWIEESQSFRYANPEARDAVEKEHHELGFLVRRQEVTGLPADDEAAIRRVVSNTHLWHLTQTDTLACYTTVDIHHGLSLDIGVDQILIDVQPALQLGQEVPTPRSEWLLLHLIFKLYWEGVHNYRKGGYQFADLTRIVPHLSEESGGALVSLLELHNLEAAGFYVLRRVLNELQTPAPKIIVAFVEAHRRAPSNERPQGCNDLGDMWFKLWGQR